MVDLKDIVIKIVEMLPAIVAICVTVYCHRDKLSRKYFGKPMFFILIMTILVIALVLSLLFGW